MVRYGDTEDVQNLLEDGACNRFQSDQDRFAYNSLIRMLEQAIVLHKLRRQQGKTLNDDELHPMWLDFRKRYLVVRFFDPLGPLQRGIVPLEA